MLVVFVVVLLWKKEISLSVIDVKRLQSISACIITIFQPKKISITIVSKKNESNRLLLLSFFKKTIVMEFYYYPFF